MVSVFREVRRVLRKDGVAWINIGDSYAGSWGAQSRGGPPSGSSTLRGNGHVGGGPKLKSLSAVQIAAHPHRQSCTGSIPKGSGLKGKDLIGVPWRVALALQADGWWLRDAIIWAKAEVDDDGVLEGGVMPGSQRDRCTSAYEMVFMLTKSAKYFFDIEACKTTSDATLRNVWRINTEPSSIKHFAMMPRKLAERCIKLGSRPGDVVFDPFNGAATTGVVARSLGRRYIGTDISAGYLAASKHRLEHGDEKTMRTRKAKPSRLPMQGLLFDDIDMEAAACH